MRTWKALGLILALCGGLLAAAVGLRGAYGRWAAAHWRGRLAAVSDERAAPLLRQVAELGEPGMALLAESLGSPRRGMALAAREVLTDRLTAWHDFSEPGGRNLEVALAEALADRVDQFDPAARSEAAALAERLVASLPDPDDDDGPPGRSRLLAACEKVLRAAPEPREYFSERVAAYASAPVSPRIAARREAPAVIPKPSGNVLRDGVGIETLPSDSQFQAAASTAADPPADRAPSQSTKGTVPFSLRENWDSPPPPRPLSASGDVRAMPEASANRASSTAGGVRAASLSAGVSNSSPAKDSAAKTALRSTDEVALMRRLRATDPAEAAQARDELVRRGMTEVQLDLARRLFDPDAEARKKLARALPALQSIDGVPWLLQLARDEDADVRLMAITLLATTGNPALMEEVEAIAQEDSDPRIQQQAQRLALLRSEKKPATWKR